MFVENFNNYLQHAFSGGDCSLNKFSGSSVTNRSVSAIAAFLTTDVGYAGHCTAFYFSDDATPNFQYSDYTFNNIADVYGSFTSTPGVDSNNNYYIQFAVNIQNNSANEVTLKNIYLCADGSTSVGTATLANINDKILMWEDTLAEPITIAAGATYNYNLKITIGSVA